MSVVEHFYTTDQIIRHCYGRTHWFDADSKRFFNSRIGVNAYPTANPFVTLFVSSERCDWNDVWKNGYMVSGDKRRYSIRRYDSRTYNIDTVGEFQEYSSWKVANRYAKKFALEMEFSLEDQHEFALLVNEDRDQTLRRNAWHREKEDRLNKMSKDLENMIASKVSEIQA